MPSDQRRFTKDKLVDFVEQALSEFAFSECPYCQAYIGIDRYINRSDIEKWLERTILSHEH